MPDIDGDKANGRKTLPIVLGHQTAAWLLLVSLLSWAVALSFFWPLQTWMQALLVLSAGAVGIAFISGKNDKKSYVAYCVGF